MSETQKHTKPNVPNLRFPGFEGEWARCTLGEIGEPYIGLTYSPADVVNEGGTIVFRSSNIQDGEIDYSDIVRVNKKIKYSIITRKDDLLICARNGSPRLIGKNALLKEADAGQTFGAFMLVFRSMDNHFVHQLLSTKGYYSQVSENLGARINQITTSNIKDFEFYFPPSTAERNKIAQFLDLIDERISIQNKVIERYQSLIRTLYREMMPHNDVEVVSLGSLVKIGKGKQVNGELLSDEGPFYVMNGGITPSGYFDDFNTPPETISISEGGNSCGYVQFNDKPFWSGGHCYTLLEPKTDVVHYKYLFHYLKSQQDEIMALRIGSGLPNIQKKDIEKFPVRLPRLEVQVQLAELFEAFCQKERTETDYQDLLCKQKHYILASVLI